MVEKYYTPSIEEFHVGFEYEKSNEPYRRGYDKKIFTEDDMYNDNFMYHFDVKNTRVKYLDKQDIEECGWEVISETKLKSYDLPSGDAHFIRTVLKRTYVDEDVIITMYDKQRVIIRRNNTRNLRAYDKNKTFDVFVGVIKNKSELKNIMKMINIF